MYLKIHRGSGQIGGNIIEVGTAYTHLIFDAGANLPPLDGHACPDTIEVAGLTKGTPAFDAVFISHHHNDHCGLLERILPGIEIYAGRETARILEVISDFTNGPQCRVTGFFADGDTCQPVKLGDLTVTPIAVAHSARDAYMFLIQGDGKNVLYTGDYRTAGNVPEAVRRLIGAEGALHLLITEGTNICTAEETGEHTKKRILADERMVEDAASRIMEAYDGTVFVLCSSTNEPRIRTMDAACRRTKRMPCHDLFLTAVRGTLAQADDCKAQPFVAGRVDERRTPRTYAYFSEYYGRRMLVGAASLAKMPQKQTVFVRTSMLPFLEKYLKVRGGGKHVLIYSMWEGYRQSVAVRNFLAFCQAQGMDILSLHCSGHAYHQEIAELIRQLEPEALVPIHCDPTERGVFEKIHEHCILLQDGECMEI